MSQHLIKTKLELEATLRRLYSIKDMSYKKRRIAIKVNRRLNTVNRQISYKYSRSQDTFNLNK